MVSLLFDENFDKRIARGLRRRLPTLESLTVQEAGLGSFKDPALLEWAANEGRVIVSHDVNTLPDFAYRRLSANLRMAGVIAVPEELSIGRAIEDLVLLLSVSRPEEFHNMVIYLPL